MNVTAWSTVMISRWRYEMKLKIGDKLFQPAHEMLRKYKVITIKITETDTLYEIECLSCEHDDGANCTMYVQPKDGHYEFLSPTNDICYRYAYLHEESLFYTSINKAYRAMYEGQIAKIENAIGDLEEEIKDNKDTLAELKKKYKEQEQERHNENITG
jgi:hypothetical protein